MAGQRPPRDKQRQQRAVQEAARERERRSQQRAVQAAARKRRVAANLPPSEPVAVPSDNLGSIEPAPPVPWGWQSITRVITSPAEIVSLEQHPAAYRFELRGGKIDILPELPEPEDRGFALDTYQELVAKAGELHERLKGTNSARRVCNSVERLLTALGTRFDDLRPGVLLSRSRSLEADRAAFGDELLPDTIAMMDDTLQTLRDLLAAFPIVRRIENERLALDLDRNADTISAIQQEMDAVKVAAAQSGAVTEEAINALTHNDAAIEDAIDPVVRTSLIADNLLVLRNFASAVIGGIAGYGRLAIAKVGPELTGLGGDIWQEIRGHLPNGVGLAVTLARYTSLPIISAIRICG